jgi:hypothetical protein
MSRQPSRALLGGTAAALSVLGALFITVLVADSGDNAYLYLAFSGGAMVVAGLPFALAALLPPGAARRWITRAALGLLALVGLLAILLLLLAVAVIPSQNYGSSTVLVSHVIGLITCIAVLGTVTMVYRRRRI